MKIAQSRAHNNTFARQTREVKVANVILSFSKRRTSPTWMREGIGKKAIDEKSYAHKTTKNEQMPNENEMHNKYNVRSRALRILSLAIQKTGQKQT